MRCRRVRRGSVESVTRHGVRLVTEQNSRTSVSAIASTKPATSPRWSPHTSSGCSAARSENGQLAKATTAASSSRGLVADDRIESEAIEVGHERLERRRRPSVPIGAGDALVTPHLHGVVGARRPGAAPCAAASAPASASSVVRGRATVHRRRSNSGAAAGRRRRGHRRRRRAGRCRASARGGGVTVLGWSSSDLGDVGGGQRPRRPGQFEVDRVPGVVTQRLQQVELPVRREAETSTRRDYTESAGKIFHMATPPTIEQVMEVLGSVIDPELGADIVTLGMVPARRRSAPTGSSRSRSN